jgi:hypothetical protein
VAFVLSGGASLGAMHVGCRALIGRGIRPDAELDAHTFLSARDADVVALGRS